MGNRDILTNNIVKTVDIIQYRLGIFEMIGTEIPTNEGVRLPIYRKDIVEISLENFIESIHCLEVDKKLKVIDVIDAVKNESPWAGIPDELSKVAEILVPLDFDEITLNYNLSLNEDKKSVYVVKKDGKDYYQNDEKVHFIDKKCLYYKIFDSMYSVRSDGNIKYKEIMKQFKSLYKKRITKEQILRSLTTDASSLYKDKRLNYLVDGNSKLIEPVRGKDYVIFCNKK